MAKETVSIKQKSKESSQDEQIKLYLENRYGNAVRFEKRHADQYSEIGLPDINLTLFGMSIQIEDKLPKEFPRDNQLEKLNQFRVAGAIVFWCDSFKMFLSKWEELVEGNELFKYMREHYKVDDRPYVYSYLEYRQSQIEDREKWMKIYKEEGVEINDK